MTPGPPAEPITLVGSIVGFGLVLVGLTRAWFWSRPLARIERRAARGDGAGAIADLQAWVARRPPALSRRGGIGSVWAWLDRPDQSLARTMLGILEGQRGRWTEALAWFERAEDVEPAEPIHRANQGHARIMLGQVDGGLAQIQQALADLARHAIDPAGRSGLWLDLAALLLEVGRPDDARTALDAAEAVVRGWAFVRPGVRNRLRAEITTLRSRLGSGPLAGPNQSC